MFAIVAVKYLGLTGSVVKLMYKKPHACFKLIAYVLMNSVSPPIKLKRSDWCFLSVEALSFSFKWSHKFKANVTYLLLSVSGRYFTGFSY